MSLAASDALNKLSKSHHDDNHNRLDIDTAIERLGMGRFQHRLLLSAGLVIAADTMEIILLSFLTLVVQDAWQLTSYETSAITATAFLGAVAGTLILGYLGDVCGRKPLFLWSTSLIASCGILTALSQNYWQMMLCQFGVGFGVGGIVVPFDAIAELIPNRERGYRLLLLGYWWTLGTMAVPVLAWVGLKEESSWRAFVLLCSIPCILSTILTYFWVPESPRWLVAKGRQGEALDVLRKAAVTNGLEPMERFPETLMLYDHQVDEEVHSIKALFQPEWRRMTFLLWSTWTGLAFLYWGTIQGKAMVV